MDDPVPGQLSARLFYLQLLAHRAHRSAYFVVARRGKNASAPSSSARRARDSRRSQLVLTLHQVASRRARAMSVRTPIPVPPGAT
jgi:hypothetical protein